MLPLQIIMNKREVAKLIELKEQLQLLRERKDVIPRVPDPEVVKHFNLLKETKKKIAIKEKVKEKIE